MTLTTILFRWCRTVTTPTHSFAGCSSLLGYHQRVSQTRWSFPVSLNQSRRVHSSPAHDINVDCHFYEHITEIKFTGLILNGPLESITGPEFLNAIGHCGWR